jgi:uncharacterized protein (TIGR03382 family)
MRLALATAALTFLALLAPDASAAPWDKPGYAVTFHDEFDGAALDTAAWGKRYKWGEAPINGELQAYVDDAFQLDSGTLRLVAEKRQGTYAGQTMQYTSGLITSVYEQMYGYFEIRCRMPKGQGFWPAFWLLGGADAVGVNEIDIHEFLGSDVNTAYTTVHWGESYSSGHQSDGKSFTGPDFTADFHTFAVDWDATHVIWFIDGAEVFRHEGTGTPQTNMYIIANLAVGGGWPGPPDATTVFPSSYDIDYIRAYARAPDAGAPSDAAADATPGEASAPDVHADVAPPTIDAQASPDADTAETEEAVSDGGCACASTRSTGPFAPLAALLLAALFAMRAGPPQARR